MWLKYLLLVMSAFVELYCINVFAGALMEKRYKNASHYFILLAFAALHSVNSIVFSNLLLIATATAISLFAVIVLFKGKFVIKLIITISFTIVVCLAESIVGGIMLIFAKLDLQNAIDIDVTAFAIGVVASKFMLFAITIFIYVVLRRKKKLYLDRKSLASIFVLPLATLFVIFVLNIVIFQLDDYKTKILFVIAAILMYSANIVTFELLFRQSEIIKTKAELEFMKSNIESQEKYYKSIFKSQEEIRRLRHDTKNFYIAAIAEIDSGNTDILRKNIAANLELINDTRQAVYTDYPALDSIINSKLLLCDEKQIKADIQYFYNDKILINEMELAVLIGNLFDNAIEANEQLRENRYIKAVIYADGSEINISFINPIIKTNPKLKTTKSDAARHGFGIKSIITIANAHEGTASFKQEDNQFSAYVNMRNKE